MKFDYFYNEQSESYSFYRTPKVFFTDDRFRCLSSDAKILYGILLDRVSLSARNKWIDEQGRIFVYMTISSIEKSIGRCHQKSCKLLDELERIGLIERVKQGQGKPTRIYVKNFIVVCGSYSKKYEKHTQGMEAQGFVRDDQGVFQVPVDGKLLMEIPSEMIPKCPDDGSDMTMNLRADDSFVEDGGWHRASAAYSDFIRRHENLHVLYLELGVGANTPVIIKYPFWQMTLSNENAVYACLNYGEAFCPGEIENRSLCIDGDIGAVLGELKK